MLTACMDTPVSVTDEGIKIKPENMVKEKLYHCIYKEKLLLVYKDGNEILNCYEIEESEIINEIKNCKNSDDIETVLEHYIEKHNLKN